MPYLTDVGGPEGHPYDIKSDGWNRIMIRRVAQGDPTIPTLLLRGNRFFGIRAASLRT